MMRIFVAGSTSAIGRRLVPLLVRDGHHVTGTTRTPYKVDAVRAMGAEPVVMDALDRAAVHDAVQAAKPDIVVHELTALSGAPRLRRFDRYIAATNRLRTTGTDNLLAAARAAEARRFVAQSFSGWPNVRSGGPVKTEEDPVDPNPPAKAREATAAIRHVETVVPAAPDIDGVVLRYGAFYGPGNTLGAGGQLLEQVRKRRFPWRRPRRQHETPPRSADPRRPPRGVRAPAGNPVHRQVPAGGRARHARALRAWGRPINISPVLVIHGHRRLSG